MVSGLLLAKDLQQLLASLQAAGYRCLGPQLHENAIVYRELESIAQLPLGLQDEQAPGHYRVQKGAAARYFAWANGPQALKPLLFRPQQGLWKVRNKGTMQFESLVPEAQAVAVIGVRACDLAALALLDQHFLQGSETPDPYYAAQRQELFLVAVNCSHPAATCFCASTGDGPQAENAYDIVLSELDAGFVLKSGSQRGEAVAKQLPLADVTAEQWREVELQGQQAAARQQRSLPSRNLQQKLFDRWQHPRWEEVAQRCLSCGNCTAVCPSCFCFREIDQSSLDGHSSEHKRQWDSCFTAGHSYLHGMEIRSTIKQRYRQWLTHKLDGWHEQYGRSGCVGCGRCISWCPAQIDITEEVQALCAEGNHVSK